MNTLLPPPTPARSFDSTADTTDVIDTATKHASDASSASLSSPPALSTAVRLPTPPDSASSAAFPIQCATLALVTIAHASELGAGSYAAVHRAHIHSGIAGSPGTECAVKVFHAPILLPVEPEDRAPVAEALQPMLDELSAYRHVASHFGSAASGHGLLHPFGVVCLPLEDEMSARASTACELMPIGEYLDAVNAHLADDASRSQSQPQQQPLQQPQQPFNKSHRLGLVLEFCPNGTLWDRCTDRAMQSSIGQDDWLGWARQLTGAVAALHTLGFVHSDIKPHNVLVARDGTLRLSDLSSATATAPAGATATAAAASDGSAPYRSPAVGTAAYSAPELLQLPPRPATPAADIYSLGVTFYVVGCTARDPFHGVKSTVERMVLAMRGMFWEWESANPTTPIARRRGLAPKTPSLPAMSSTFAPSQPVSQTPPPAPPPRFNLPSAASSNSSAGSRTSALGRSQTITSPPLSSVRSRPSAALQIDTSVSSSPSLDGKSTLDIPHDPALALYYLDGSPVPQPLARLLRSMVALSPADRPSPFDVMKALSAFASQPSLL